MFNTLWDSSILHWCVNIRIKGILSKKKPHIAVGYDLKGGLALNTKERNHCELRSLCSSPWYSMPPLCISTVEAPWLFSRLYQRSSKDALTGGDTARIPLMGLYLGLRWRSSDKFDNLFHFLRGEYLPNPITPVEHRPATTLLHPSLLWVISTFNLFLASPQQRSCPPSLQLSPHFHGCHPLSSMTLPRSLGVSGLSHTPSLKWPGLRWSVPWPESREHITQHLLTSARATVKPLSK